MKLRFSTLDIIALLPELNELCKGLRVLNIYNVNNKVYLFKLVKNTGELENEENVNKNFLLIESGIRMHLTAYDWPKEAHPNGFTMKLRKHVKNKRIEYIKQIGYDRIVDVQFGTNEAAYHLIIEFYDRGNMFLTDRNFVILNLLRPRKDGENEDVKFKVNEIYPIKRFESSTSEILERKEIEELLANGKAGDNLKKLFNPRFNAKLKIYGPSLLEHCFIECGLGENCKLDENKWADIDKIYNAIVMAKSIVDTIGERRVGYIVQKEEDNVLAKENEENKKIISFLEFNPMIFAQYKNLEKKNQSLVEYDSFNKAIDTFFSSIEGQKIDNRVYQKEKDAMKKLDNIKKDHQKRLQDLGQLQLDDNRKGYLIQANNEIVEKALFILRSALARQMPWSDIKQMLKEAQEAGDLVASKICSLKFDINAFTMLLDDPYEQADDSKSNPSKVDISLELSAHGNARKYFEERKVAQKKEEKTIEASGRALKSAQIKTAQALKEVQLKISIVKSRKVIWFEKFFWFISSENYIVIGGRDAQQNELIVKRYLKPGDLYVHADLHGATSVVIKNRTSKSKIPSKTIEEAGCMAVCYSSAWEAKTPVRAWWVNADQVSKTAPSGEYLTIGSFMIRGKKNYLPQTQLVMGFSFFFRLDEESIQNHVNDRKVKYVEIEDVANDTINQIKEEEDEEVSSFPDTKIETVKKTDQEMILEAMKSRLKTQRKLKKKEAVKLEETSLKLQQQNQKQNQKNNNKKGKGKGKRNKKNDDWSDDEDKITIKLNKKLQKDSRLQKIEDQTVALSVEELTDEEIADVNEESAVEVNDNQQLDEQTNDIVDNNETEILQPESEQNQNGSGESSDDEKIVDHENEEEEEEEEAEAETTDERREMEYLKLVNSLTGQPLANDVLLYCIPVVAPYQSVVNCKYKVKVLPGTNKRGRSAKTAIQVFLNEKNITSRERDLIKSMRDLDIARNLPNKIKVTAQNLQQVKRKKP